MRQWNPDAQLLVLAVLALFGDFLGRWTAGHLKVREKVVRKKV